MEWPHWSVYVVLLVAWFWQNCVHEASHLLAIWKFEGKKPKGFYPYPHKYNGQFYFARCAYEPFRLPGAPIVYSAPLVTASIQVLFLAVIWLLLRMQGLGDDLSWYWFALYACPLGDALWWSGSYFWGKPISDGQRWRVAMRVFTKRGQR